MNRKIWMAMSLLFLCQPAYAGEIGSGNTGNITAPLFEARVATMGTESRSC